MLSGSKQIAIGTKSAANYPLVHPSQLKFAGGAAAYQRTQVFLLALVYVFGSEKGPLDINMHTNGHRSSASRWRLRASSACSQPTCTHEFGVSASG